MVFELFRHVNPSKIGVAVELNSEHVVGLPFEPVSSRPEVCNRRNMEIGLINPNLDADPAIVFQRVEVINDFEAVVRAIVVGAGKVSQRIEGELSVVAKEAAYAADLASSNNDREFAAILIDRIDRIPELSVKLFENLVLHQAPQFPGCRSSPAGPVFPRA